MPDVAHLPWFVVSVGRHPVSSSRSDNVARRIEGWMFVQAATSALAQMAAEHCDNVEGRHLVASHLPRGSSLPELLEGMACSYANRLLLPAEYEELMLYAKVRLKDKLAKVSSDPWYVVSWAKDGKSYRFILQVTSPGAAVGAVNLLVPGVPPYKRVSSLEDARVAHLNVPLLDYLKTAKARKYRSRRLSARKWDDLLQEAGVTRVSYVYE